MIRKVTQSLAFTFRRRTPISALTFFAFLFFAASSLSAQSKLSTK
jgi:hypothetical protein